LTRPDQTRPDQTRPVKVVMPKKGIMFSLLIESIFWCAFLWAFLLYDKVAIEITESQNESDFDILKEIFQTDTDRGFI